MPKSILVTGASRGIGRATALYLAERGFRVFSGVRQEVDGEALREAGGEAIVPLQLDVTSDADIANAIERIEQTTGDRGLDGLVNNAGMVVAGPLEGMSHDVLRHQFDVNVFGLWAVTHASLPLLRRAAGCVVNVSSINGRIVTPFAAPYAASKFALEALSDGLRLELARSRVRVVVVEPGAIRTDIWETTGRRTRELAARMPATVRDSYPGVFRSIEGGVRVPTRAIAADRVARVIERALAAKRPRSRYLVGWDARIGAFARWLLPDRVLDRLMLGRHRRRRDG